MAGFSTPGAAGITKLSELEIDAGKDWQAKEISNLKGIVASMAQGDLPFRGASIVEALTKGFEGHYLKQGATAPLWSSVVGKPLFRCVTLLPCDAVLPTANPPAKTKTDGANFTYDTLDFDPDTEQSAYWVFNLSPDYTDENFMLLIRWKSTATTGDVKWGLSVLGREEGEVWDAALGTEQTKITTAQDVAGELAYSLIPSFNPLCSPNDTVIVKLARKAADGLDTMAADACVTEVFLVFAPKTIISTFTPIDPTDVSPAIEGSWEDVDLSGSLPSGATGAIFHIINTDSDNQSIGLRKKGSTDDRTSNLYAHSQVWGMIGVDENRYCQIYRGKKPEVKFWLVGYTTAGVNFFTNGKDKSLAGAESWITIDLAADCPNAKAIIIEITTTTNYGYGFRKYGSTDTNCENVGEEYSTGYIYNHCWAIIGCDEYQRIQGWVKGVDVALHVVGYVTEGVAMRTNSVQKLFAKSEDYDDTYHELDCSAEAPGANMLFFEATQAQPGTYKCAIRKKGETGDLYENFQMHPFIVVECDSEQKIEYKGQVNTMNLRLYLVGYSIPSA